LRWYSYWNCETYLRLAHVAGALQRRAGTRTSTLESRLLVQLQPSMKCSIPSKSIAVDSDNGVRNYHCSCGCNRITNAQGGPTVVDWSSSLLSKRRIASFASDWVLAVCACAFAPFCLSHGLSPPRFNPPRGFAEVNPRRRVLPCDGSGGHRGRPICCSPLSDLIWSSLQYNTITKFV
jgi:hypothetical protein